MFLDPIFDSPQQCCTFLRIYPSLWTCASWGGPKSVLAERSEHSNPFCIGKTPSRLLKKSSMPTLLYSYALCRKSNMAEQCCLLWCFRLPSLSWLARRLCLYNLAICILLLYYLKGDILPLNVQHFVSCRPVLSGLCSLLVKCYTDTYLIVLWPLHCSVQFLYVYDLQYLLESNLAICSVHNHHLSS